MKKTQAHTQACVYSLTESLVKSKMDKNVAKVELTLNEWLIFDADASQKNRITIGAFLAISIDDQKIFYWS